MTHEDVQASAPADAKTLRIGYIGLGDMGAAMAQNIVNHGWPLTLYARRAASLEPFKDLPVKIAETPRDAGAASDVLCLCVVDESQIMDVLFGPDGAAEGLAKGSVVVVHSTVAPESCLRVNERLAPLGIHLIDAPVTGAADRGRAGELSILIGGDEAVVRRCMPLFETEGALVAHLGKLGSGQVVKLMNNGLFFMQVSLVDEILKLGEKMSLDVDTLLKVLDSGTAASWASGYIKRVRGMGCEIYGDYETSYPGGIIEIVRKDMNLFLDQLGKSGLGGARIVEIAKGSVDSVRQPVKQDA